MMDLHTRVSLLRNIVGANGVVARDAREVVEANLGKVTCGVNCSNCCFSKILTDSAEGIAMYLYLRSDGRWNPEMRARLVEADEAMTKHTHKTWAERYIPCALLDGTTPGRGVCVVYPARPVGCAMTFSVGGDPSRCAEVGHVEGGQIQVFYRGQSMVNLMHIRHSLLPEVLRDAFVYTTLPGSILKGEALVEGQILPEVREVAFDAVDGAESLQQVFDSVAEVR